MTSVGPSLFNYQDDAWSNKQKVYTYKFLRFHGNSLWEHPHDSTSLPLSNSPFFLTALLPVSLTPVSAPRSRTRHCFPSEQCSLCLSPSINLRLPIPNQPRSQRTLTMLAKRPYSVPPASRTNPDQKVASSNHVGVTNVCGIL